ncbi:MAG TPA: NapC/NirT family cytochrome c [Candidatus Binataceae bacterium]|nr:NapC/NirT family cytochrome c [Candidatus Binataceae bacterium]
MNDQGAQYIPRPGSLLNFLRVGPPFQEQWGSWVDWGILLTLILCLTIIGLIIATRIFYRNRLTEGGARVIHVLALSVLPLLMLPFANFTVMEYTKQVNFCGSCHLAMQPYMNDMLKPGNQSLAALHFQDRFAPTQPGTECYECHADYGVHGTFIVKIQGLHDAYSYMTGNYTLPIKLKKPLSGEMCLKCHVDAKPFLSQALHLDKTGKVSPLILSGTIRCEMCHPTGHMVNG